MDGTLYRYRNGSFAGSSLEKAIDEKAKAYVSSRLGLDRNRTEATLDDLRQKYEGHTSIGLERECGIDRYEFFANTWDNDPAEHFIVDGGLRDLLAGLADRYEMVILSDAPRVWIDRVLEHLDVTEFFRGRVYSGEGDIRKARNNAFETLLEKLGVPPEDVISIGDQIETDIVPAKKIGCTTVLVGGDKNVGEADYHIRDIFGLSDLLRDLGM